MLQGLLPTGEQSSEELEKTLLEGRYQEIRMLFYVGRDILRWIDQCVDHVSRYPEMQKAVDDQVALVLAGSKPVADAVKEMNAKVNSILKE